MAKGQSSAGKCASKVMAQAVCAASRSLVSSGCKDTCELIALSIYNIVRK